MEVRLRHILRLLYREISQVELRLMFAAVLLTVTAMATIGLFTDRVARTLTMQSNELLGADLIITSSRSIPGEWIDQAKQYGLKTAMTREFPSVVVSGNKTTLVEVKAVSSAYPLRGQLEIRRLKAAESSIFQGSPQSAHIWVDRRLLNVLELQPGADLQLGRQDFKISAVIEHEPDRGGNFFALAPRVMMGDSDLQATGLIGPGSRIKFRLLLAGSSETLERYRSWLKPRLGDHYRILSVRETRPEVKQSLERAEHFLSLSVIVALVLAGLAMWVASRSWLQKRLMHAAILRSIGLTRAQVLLLYFGQLLILVGTASVIAVALAWGLQSLLAIALNEYTRTPLVEPRTFAALVACLAGLLLVIAFTLPAYLRLAAASPMLVLRGQQSRFEASSPSIIIGVLVLAVILFWQIGDFTLLTYIGAGLAVSMLLLVLLSGLLVHIARHMVRLKLPTGIRLGLKAIISHRRETILMMSTYGLSFMFIVLLTLVRGDLIDQWRAQLPTDTPNFFLINVQPNELVNVDQWLQKKGMRHIQFYPMVKGRLISINDRKVEESDYEGGRAKRLLQREFNLSWHTRLPEHNKLTSGQWWHESSSDGGQWSVETGIAETLNIRMGDQLTYDVAGQKISGKVTSLREVRWDSFKVNFFVIGKKSMIEALPSTYISSFYLPVNEHNLMSELVATFPSITVIDVNALMGRIRAVIDRVGIAAESAFIFTLLAAVLLMISMVISSRSLREYETVLLRSMGVTGRDLQVALRTEFVFIGLSAGVISVLSANGLAWLLSARLLEIPFQFNFQLAVVVVLAGVLLIAMTGWWLLRELNRQSPMVLLRELS
ncbi:MAG: FtsX-like permease family protein [Gammaproteobacteria bacterium]|nr:MAG: FtsX-like permease family protein [Gammaproteobacteria bacterium]